MVEDISLARQVNKKRLRWRVAYVADLISCRMYRTSREAVDGFTRNLFAAFDYRLIPFLFAFIWLFMMFLEPMMVLTVRIAGGAPQAQLIALAACLVLSILLWLIPYAEMRIPLWLSFLYPLTTLANMGVAFRSLVHTLQGRQTWKDRAIEKPRWRWF
jgi:chlorobactene glucosyltransferase